MRDKVLSKIIFWEYMIVGLAVSLFCFVILREILVRGTREPFECIYLIPFGIVIIQCAMKLGRKFRSAKPPEAPIYEHSIGRVEKRKLSSVFYGVLVLFLAIFLSFLYMNRLHTFNDQRLLVACGVLWIASGFLRSYRSFHHSLRNYELKITTALSRQYLCISYPDEDFLSHYINFPLDEIVKARIVTAEDPEIREHLINEHWRIKTIRTNVKMSGAYMYAFFLNDHFPLPDGHQAVDLKLKNGRHVLFETDDAENFLMSLISVSGGERDSEN